MPIVDKELVNSTPLENMKCPNQSIGDFLLGQIQSQIAQHGDFDWMVSLKKRNLLKSMKN